MIWMLAIPPQRSPFREFKVVLGTALLEFQNLVHHRWHNSTRFLRYSDQQRCIGKPGMGTKMLHRGDTTSLLGRLFQTKC